MFWSMQCRLSFLDFFTDLPSDWSSLCPEQVADFCSVRSTDVPRERQFLSGSDTLDTLATSETCGSQFWEPDGPSPPKLGIIRIKCLKEHQQRQRWKLWHFHSKSYWNILKSYINHKFTTPLDLEDTGKPKSHRHIVRSCRLRWNGDKPIQRRKYRKW